MAGAASIAAIRERYAASVAAAAPSVRRAFATVPRERFLGPGPWRIRNEAGGYDLTPDADPLHVYRDVLVALDSESGINNGQPSLHAVALDALALGAGEAVHHVGAGTGYYTAIIAELVGPSGSVRGWEVEPTLAEIAAENLADRPNVSMIARSATAAPLPPADAVYVSAGAARPVRGWLDALRPGGRLLFPLTGSSGRGGMLLVTRRPGGLAARFVCGAMFIPCIGARDPHDAARLERARWDRSAEVRSLRLDSAPDATAWVAGDGWWLSSAATD